MQAASGLPADRRRRPGGYQAFALQGRTGLRRPARPPTGGRLPERGCEGGGEGMAHISFASRSVKPVRYAWPLRALPVRPVHWPPPDEGVLRGGGRGADLFSDSNLNRL
jgi:hypothetical protein